MRQPAEYCKYCGDETDDARARATGVCSQCRGESSFFDGKFDDYLDGTAHREPEGDED